MAFGVSLYPKEDTTKPDSYKALWTSPTDMWDVLLKARARICEPGFKSDEYAIVLNRTAVEQVKKYALYSDVVQVSIQGILLGTHLFNLWSIPIHGRLYAAHEHREVEKLFPMNCELFVVRKDCLHLISF